MVSRVACNGGVTGEVVPPELRIKDSEIVVTFRFRPVDPASATCPLNELVPYKVMLNEPIGKRFLIDGQCLLGGKAADTSFCRDPERLRP